MLRVDVQMSKIKENLKKVVRAKLLLFINLNILPIIIPTTIRRQDSGKI